MDMFSGFAVWWKKPFAMEGDAVSWFLFIGLVLVIIFLWTRILKEAGHFVGFSE
jgi:hypothetical protein